MAIFVCEKSVIFPKNAASSLTIDHTQKQKPESSFWPLSLYLYSIFLSIQGLAALNENSFKPNFGAPVLGTNLKKLIATGDGLF